MKSEIAYLLHRLGVTANYIGYRQTVIAVDLILDDETRLMHICDRVYRPTAEALGCDTRCIERNIRTVIRQAWQKNRKLLVELASFPLIAEPNVSQFLDILAHHIRRTHRITSEKSSPSDH